MIKIAVVEDNKSEADALVALFDRYKKETGATVAVTCFKGGDSFLFGYMGGYDVCFIDMELSGICGMTLAKKLRDVDRSIYIIFTSNNAQNAILGYEVDALDYFLRPVHYSALKARLDQVEKELQRADAALALPDNAGGGYFLIRLRDILYIESDNHTLIYHTVDKSLPYRDRSMKRVEDELRTHDFARCNVCYLVNLKHVTKVVGNTVWLGEKTLQISRAKRKEFMGAINELCAFKKQKKEESAKQ